MRIQGLLCDYETLDLSERSLEKAILEIGAMCKEQGLQIALTPTTLLMVRYPEETDTEWGERCARAVKLTKEK